jgi:hypothetical protein
VRRRTFAPRRPTLYPEQIPLAVLSVLAVVVGIVAVIIALRG